MAPTACSDTLVEENIYVQVIDDAAGRRLHPHQALMAGLRGRIKMAQECLPPQKLVGKLTRRARKPASRKVVFDRGDLLYHGRIKALAEAAAKAV